MPDQSSAANEHALLQEITAPLEKLPDDPLALVEAEFPTAMRGYDRHAVDDYVGQITRLVAELHATRSPEAAVRRALERVGDQISGVLQRAHETAEQITAQSRMEAEDRLERARREGLTLIEAAERRVRELDADADRVWAERARIVADAEALSGQLLAVARDAAARFPDEENRTAPMTDRSAGFAEPEAPRGAEEAEEAEASPDADTGTDDSAAAGHTGGSAEDADTTEAAADTTEDADSTEDAGPENEGAAGPDEVEVEVEDPTLPIDPTERITLSQDDSTRIIPPSSDAARRRDG
jgi:DivIVA domain-containing protein